MRRRFTLVLLPLVCATSLADIAPPPEPLHRVGYEVLPRELTHAAECLGTAGGVLFVIGFLLAVGLFFAVKFPKALKRRTKCVGFAASLCGLAIGGVLAACFSPPAKDWKYPSQVLPWEEKSFDEKIETGKAELQKRFDSEYARMCEAGELERIGPFEGEFRYRYNRAKNDMRIRNARTVVSRLLEQDATLRSHYDGVPLEWIAFKVNCPDPSTCETPDTPQRGHMDALKAWKTRDGIRSRENVGENESAKTDMR